MTDWKFVEKPPLTAEDWDAEFGVSPQSAEEDEHGWTR